MQRRTILALLAPCALLSAAALADPGQTPGTPTVWPSDAPAAPVDPTGAPTPPSQPPMDAPTEAPLDTPTAAPASEVPPGWPQPSTTAPDTSASGTTPPTLPAPDAATPIALFAMRPPVASALYLQGFDVSWETRPHRLQSLVVVADAGAPAAQTPPSGALLARVQGGSWADGRVARDEALVNIAYGGVSSREASIYRGAVRTAVRGDASPMGAREPAIVTIPVEVPLTAATSAAPATGGTTEMPMEVPMEAPMEAPTETPMGTAPETPPAAGTAPPEAANQAADEARAARYDGGAVFLQGIAIQTDAAHPDGFTPHVLAVQLGPVTVRDGIARFDLTVEVQAAAVPDREQHLTDYGAEVEVGWVLVPAAAERVHRLEASGGAAHGIEVEATASKGEPVPLPVGVDLQPDTEDVAVGLSGFRVAIDQAGLDSGRYLRSLGMTVADAGVDPWRRRWDGVVEARFSNAGEVTRADAVALQADVTVLELGEGDRSWSGRWSTSVSGGDQQLPYPRPAQTGRR